MYQSNFKDSELEAPLLTAENINTKNSSVLNNFQFKNTQNNNNNNNDKYFSQNVEQKKIFDDVTQKRLVYLDGTVYPPQTENINNLVKNYKYTANSFFPKVLYNYFKHFQNLLFLMLTLIQLFPLFTVSYYYAVITPFGLTCFLLFYKESIDDKHRRDNNGYINQESYKVLRNMGEDTVKCQDIKVGDLLLLNSNQRVPADVVLLHTPGETNGQLFVNCEQIDGKSDISIKRSISCSHNYALHNSLTTLKACVEIGPANKLIDSFKGKFKREARGHESQLEEPITLHNTIWSNSQLTAGKAIGLVIYTGYETKSQMNWENFHYKQPKIDQQMNKLTYLYFTFFLILALSVSVFAGFDQSWNYEFVRNVLMYLTVLPLSVRFCLTISKILLCNRINADRLLPHLKINNRNNIEDLGKFEFMLCDKTGTITKNQMEFKQLRLLDETFYISELQNIKEILLEQCEKFTGPCADQNDKMPLKNNRNRDTHITLRDTFTAISLCNGVVPIAQGVNVTYQASSQDEISLVKVAEQLGMRLINKNKNVIEIENTAGNTEIYRIIHEFPFTYEVRKIGILLFCEQSKKYIYFTKGTGESMLNVIPERQMPFIMEQNEILGNQGLRTMVFGYRYITKKDFDDWFAKYEISLKQGYVRDHSIIQAQNELENGVQFLAISGIEEQVQDQVAETFQALRESGIKIWIVTGDNVTITKQIAILSKFKTEKQNFHTLQNLRSEYNIFLSLSNLDKQLSISKNCILVVDATSYKTAIRFKEQYFFELLKLCTSVIFCNFTPAQKGSLTLTIKRYYSEGNQPNNNKYIFAVGNGINDVQMFQKVDFSICLSEEINEEAQKQVTISSDLRIHQFKDLQRLLQFYGLNGYKRSTVMLSYLVQRGIQLAIIQAIFSVLYDIQIQIFSPLITLLMSTVFCIFPVMCIMNHFDYNMETTQQHREIYMYLQKNRELSTKNFLIWSFRAIYQGVVLMTMGLYIFPDHFDLQNMALIVFIIIELLNMWSEISISFFALMFSILQVALYTGALYLEHGHFEVIKDLVYDQAYMSKIGIIVAAAYIPPQILKSIMNNRLPSDYQRVLKAIKDDSKLLLQQNQEKTKVEKELEEYNLEMEKKWLEEQQKINPDIENPDYTPPPSVQKQPQQQQQQSTKTKTNNKKTDSKQPKSNNTSSQKTVNNSLLSMSQVKLQSQKNSQKNSQNNSQKNSQKSQINNNNSNSINLLNSLNNSNLEGKQENPQEIKNQDKK